MSIDKKRLYICLYSLLTLLLICLFIPIYIVKQILVGILLIYSFLVCYFVKKRNILSIHKKEVLMIVSVISLMYLMIYYLTGLKFGFYKSSHTLSFDTIFKYVLPFSLIIISTEVIRYVFLVQNKKSVKVISFICCVLIDFLMVYNIFSLNSFNQFIDALALTLFPSITFNILYHNISEKYGCLPNIIFKLIITLYIYFLPVVPATPSSIIAISKIVVPLLVLWFINALYGRKTTTKTVKMTKISNYLFVTTIVIMFFIIMLVSNQFKYGSVVIATPSMTGEINVGDVIIYERIDNDDVISIGEVIVFKQNDSLIIHRVDYIEYIDGVLRYYTKGDANEHRDPGFITRDQIVGVTNVKISYIGYPTLWMMELFNSEK